MVDPPFESKRAMRSFILESVEGINALLQALNHPKRIEVLAVLLDEPKEFKALVEATGFAKSALSNHLSVLTAKNLIEKVDRGLYRLTLDGEIFLGRIAHSYLEIKIHEQEKLENLRKLIGRYTTFYEAPTMRNKDKPTEPEDLEVRIVKLESMRVASFHALGKTPENDAYNKLRAWSEPKKLFDNPTKYPVYGFNNPDPSPDSEEYGYEFWIRMSPDIQPEDIEVKEFQGGLYAVTTTKIQIDPDENMIPAWKKLIDWVKSNSNYKFGRHQFLEKHLNPWAPPEDFILDLYCPIEEKK